MTATILDSGQHGDSKAASQRPDAGQNRITTSRVAFIEGLRGVAVLCVLLCHAVGIDFDGHGPIAPQISYWLSHGVDLFFAISGYCLANLLRERPTMQYSVFLIRRFLRIAPAYYVSLLAFVALGYTAFGTPGYRPTGSDLIHSLFFAIPLDGARVNGVLWTIPVEARWYLVCPALILLYARSARAFLSLAFASYLVYELGPIFDDAGYLPCFMLGIVAADIIRRKHPVYRYANLGVALLLPIAIAMPQRGMNIWHVNPIWHLAVFAIMLAGSRPFVARLLSIRPLRAIGTASYSIYLTQLPVLIWLSGKHVGFPIALCATLAVGFIFWACVERPLQAPAVQDRVEGFLTNLTFGFYCKFERALQLKSSPDDIR